MENQKYYEKEILHIAVTGCAVAVNKDTYVPMTCSKDMCEHCINHKENGRCDKEKTAILIWMKEEYIDPAERIDWSKVAIDTPVLVRNSERDTWENAHYAGWKIDGVCVFPNGKTSYTFSENDKKNVGLITYKHARLAVHYPFNKDLFYQLYEQLLTLPADCQGKEDNCNEDCPYRKDGNCMYYRLKGFVEDNPDVLGDIEPELSTDFMMS